MRTNLRFTSVMLMGLVLSLFSIGVAAQTTEPVPAFDQWTLHEGSWSVWDNTLLHMDNMGGNTNAYVALEQQGDILVYEWTVQFLDRAGALGPHAGLHILSNDATQGAQRGDSYLIWQEGPNMKVYKSHGGSRLATVITVPMVATVGESYRYHVTVDTQEKVITVYRNGEFVLTWPDPDLITSGSYISARTNVTTAIFSDVR